MKKGTPTAIKQGLLTSTLRSDVDQAVTAFRPAEAGYVAAVIQRTRAKSPVNRWSHKVRAIGPVWQIGPTSLSSW